MEFSSHSFEQMKYVLCADDILMQRAITLCRRKETGKVGGTHGKSAPHEAFQHIQDHARECLERYENMQP